MLEKLKNFIEKERLLKEGERVIVGYSGGADSTCLLHLLHRAGYQVIAAHLHHGQRHDADDEAGHCDEFARQIGAEFVLGKADVPLISREQKVGIEEAGRLARYEFFRQTSAQYGGARVATAHTLDDNAETVLLNICRGSGLAGVAGIPLVRDNIIRPLLWLRRAETRAYCEEMGFWFHDDPANFDESYARVILRKRVFPQLEEVNSRATEHIARLTEMARDEDSLLDSMAASMLESAEKRSLHPLSFLARMSEAELDLDKLRHFPHPLVRRGVRLLAKALGAHASYEQAELIAAAVFAREKTSFTVEGGAVVFELSPPVFTARRLEKPEPYRELLPVPGELASDEFGWRLAAYETAEEPSPERRSLSAVMDAASKVGELYVRPMKPGDKMAPIGGNETSLGKLLTNARVTGSMKARLPIVCDMAGPVWVPSVCLAERVKVREGTSRRLALQFGPVSAD